MNEDVFPIENGKVAAIVMLVNSVVYISSKTLLNLPD